MKKIRHMLEAALLLLVMLVFKILPLDTASSLGGVLGRLIGPFLRAHRVADSNLKRIFPQYSERERSVILAKMWDNLGRVGGEYPHLSPEVMSKRITVEGIKYLDEFRDKGAVFVSGHFANWEICPLIGVIYKLPIVFIYREANNPYAEKLIQWMRKGYSQMMYGKGRESAQQAIRALQNKRSMAMLADQKLNEGVNVPFFGYDAMTVTSAAKLAIKFKVPLIPLHVVRTDGAHFHVTVHEPRYYDASADPVKVMEDIHYLFESWIRECPEQWFWVHNRWSWKLS